MNPSIVIVGGGGHSHVLLDALLSRGYKADSIVIVDADSVRTGTSIMGVPIVGTDEMLGYLAREGCRSFAVAVGGTGNNRPRAALFEQAVSLGLRPLTIVHPSAVVSPWATIGEGCQILPTAVVNARATVGVNTIINTAAVVEHDCAIGDHVHVATGARLASTVSVSRLAHIGAGAVIRQLISVGEAAVVGAGAVVVKDVGANSVVAGVPAKELL